MSLFIPILLWILTGLLGLVAVLVVYTSWNYGSLEKLGIPVIKPFLIFGSNYMEAYLDIQKQDIERHRKYGDIYGAYDGRRAQIYISDPKLIRRITTADFDHFQNHGWVVGTDSESIFENILDLLKDEKWKTVRGALTPIFTSGKIKQLNTVVQSIGEDYAETLMVQCCSAGGRISGIRFKEFLAPMIIEILGKCFCGIEIPNAKDPKNEFVQNMKLALWHDPIIQEGWRTLVPKIFPILTSMTPPMEMGGMDFFVSALKNILATREKAGEASIDATSTLVEMMKKVRSDPVYRKLKISENVVLAQGWEFFIAGYVGIRDLFDFFMYEMASNPEVQDRVHSEIKTAARGHLGTSLEDISQLPFLSACIEETGRLHPVFIRPERVCNKDWTFEGLSIPKGMQVIFPMAAIHRNPEYFPNPDQFEPSRFLGGKKEMDPYAYMTFGHGPRSCIGQRFALEMLKVLVVSFLARFKMERRSDTICETNPGGSLMLNFKPLFLDIVKR